MKVVKSIVKEYLSFNNCTYKNMRECLMEDMKFLSTNHNIYYFKYWALLTDWKILAVPVPINDECKPINEFDISAILVDWFKYMYGSKTTIHFSPFDPPMIAINHNWDFKYLDEFQDVNQNVFVDMALTIEDIYHNLK